MHTPRLLRTMPGKRKWQFLFAQTWYPLWSVSYLIMFLSPVIALILNRNVADTDPLAMLLHFAPLYLCGFLVWLSARPIMQPQSLKLSWRGIILHAITWPIILRAIIAALFKVKKPYMITPKGSYAQSAPSIATYRSFLLLGLLSAGSVVITTILRDGRVPLAQSVFAITNTIFMLSVCFIDMGIRAAQVRPKIHEVREFWLKPIFATAMLALVLGGAFFTVSLSASKQRVYAEKNQQVAQAESIVAPKTIEEMTTDELIKYISTVPLRKKSVPTLGMYNVASDQLNNKSSYIQHSFVDWRDDHQFALDLATLASH